jgi:hypothetical protein
MRIYLDSLIYVEIDMLLNIIGIGNGMCFDDNFPPFLPSFIYNR